MTANKDRHKYIPILYLILLSMPFWAYGDSHMVTHGEPIATIQSMDLTLHDSGPSGPFIYPKWVGTAVPTHFKLVAELRLLLTIWVLP